MRKTNETIQHQPDRSLVAANPVRPTQKDDPMNDHIEVHREEAEELEVFLRMLARASKEDLENLLEGGMNEAAETFADALEQKLEAARGAT